MSTNSNYLCFPWCFILFCTAILFTEEIYSQEHSVKPGINKPYERPNFEQWIYRFERPGREVYDRRHRIVDATHVKPGMVVADIGAGTGLFTLLFSPKVGPSGRVIAVDISDVFVENIIRKAHEKRLMNVKGVVNTPTDVSLPPESIDLAFLCDTYHHFEYPMSMLQSIHKAMRTGAILVVVDFRRIRGLSSRWIMNHVRAGKQTVKKEIEASGFKLIEDNNFLRTNYFLRFKKIYN